MGISGVFRNKAASHDAADASACVAIADALNQALWQFQREMLLSDAAAVFVTRAGAVGVWRADDVGSWAAWLHLSRLDRYEHFRHSLSPFDLDDADGMEAYGRAVAGLKSHIDDMAVEAWLELKSQIRGESPIGGLPPRVCPPMRDAAWFDREHADNDLAYEDGDIEYLDHARRQRLLILSEIRGTTPE